MRTFLETLGWALLSCFVCLIIWLLGLGGVVRASVAAGHLLDWVMGGLCLLWLLVILKAPWDLYFQAHAVTFELQRSQERQIPIKEGREAYLRRLQQRLGWLAVGAHLLSAALIAAVTYHAHSAVGYYFAVFYLVSTAFRPALAGYVYLTHKLQAIGEEVRYPREDIAELRQKLLWQEATVRSLMDQMKESREEQQREVSTRGVEDRELRGKVEAISREFETTISRLTDNQEVIKGIQAFVRLIAQSM